LKEKAGLKVIQAVSTRGVETPEKSIPIYRYDMENTMSYKIDNAHSQVQFTVRHMMISKARGWFEKFEGTVNLDESTPVNTTVEVKIDANSINTRDTARDAHLKSADFFDADNYPYLQVSGSECCFHSWAPSR
jgi:polyisoprenoid-binding protein YceI